MINNLSAASTELLQNNNNIVIISHYNPDGDALGSSIALFHYFRRKEKKNITIILPNDYPDFLKWMISDDISIYINTTQNKNKISEIIAKADIIYCVDFNALHRTNQLENEIRKAKSIKVLIDHHLEPELDVFDYCYSKTETSSTAELIFDFIQNNGDKLIIDKDIATAIYVGIITDTGSFSYSNNLPETYEKIAVLVRAGIDCALIQRLVYSNFSENRMRLFGLCLSENLYVLKEFNTAYIILTLSDLKKYSYKAGDTEGIVNYAMAIKEIKFAALFVERNNVIRISFRSFGNLSVNKIAKHLFEGGGHKNAAGANSYKNLQETLDDFKAILPRLDDFIDLN